MSDKSNVINIRSTNHFRHLMEKSYKYPVIVDYYATWCGPCKKIAPIFDDLSHNYNTESVKMIFGRINVEDFDKLSADQHIMKMPTFIVYKDGIQVERVERSNRNRLSKMILHHI